MKKKVNFQAWKYKFHVPKIIIIMKLTMFLVLINVFAAFAEGYSQNTKLTLSMKGATLKQVLMQIETQSEFTFAFNSNKVDLQHIVNAEFKDAKISDILDELFKNTNVSYLIKDKHIVLFIDTKGQSGFILQQRKANVEITNESANQTELLLLKSGIQVTGIVKEPKNDLPVPFVNITVEGTTEGAFSDLDGKFSIEVPSDNAVLLFSCVGYKSTKVSLAGKKELVVILEESDKIFDEVVVVGYGTQKRSDLTGVVSSVQTNEMQKLAVPTLDQALQGRASGVFISRSSGKPGDGAKIYIRGAGSINNTDPLYIIDGIKSSAGNTLNMNDVESVEILKDASAASIYGAEAANGVILVTTKRGKKGKTSLKVNSYTGINYAMNIPELANTEQYASLKGESRKAANLGVIPRFANPDSIKYLPSTNWMKELISPATTKSVDVSLSGGNESANYFISGNYYKENGTLYESSFERFSIRCNSDFTIGKRFKIGEQFMASMINNDPTTVSLHDIIRVLPNIPVYDPSNIYGGYGYINKDLDDSGGGNPYGWEAINDQKERTYRINTNVYGDYEILKGLNLRATFSGNYDLNYNWRFRDKHFFNISITDDLAKLNQEYAQQINLTANSVLTYNKTFGDNSLTVMAGYEAWRYDRQSFSAEGRGFPGNLKVLDASLPANKLSWGNNDLERKISQFGRLNYSLKDKYLFSASVRRDGSSKFGGNYQYGVFPSVSAGWRLDKEEFIKSLPQISFLKLRGSWGRLGNDKIPNFLARKTYGIWGTCYSFGTGDQTVVPGATAGMLPNADIKWETTEQTDIGFDLSLFDNAIEFNADYYIKNTKDMLINVAIPRYSGYDPGNDPYQNIGEIQNKGIEFSIGYHGNFNGIGLNITGNAGFNRNKVLKLNEDNFILSGFDWGPYNVEAASRTEKGQPMGFFYGYVVDKLFQNQDEIDALNKKIPKLDKDGNVRKDANGNILYQNYYYQNINTAPGDIKFKDLGSFDANGKIIGIPDTLINSADKAMIGNPWPKVVYGLNMNVEYKSFDLSVFFQGLYGRDLYDGLKYFLENVQNDYNFSSKMEDRWTPENTNTNIPRLNYMDPNRNGPTVSTRYIENGSYLRLKNVQLGYTLPKQILQWMHVVNLRIYISGQNLLTFTKYSGIDPEFSRDDNRSTGIDTGIYPQSKTFIGGFQFEF